MAVLLALPTIAADATDGSENPYRQSRRGYRIIVDGGTYFDIHKASDQPQEDVLRIRKERDSGLFEMRFSNGFQFNNYFYLGGGIAVDYFSNDKLWSAPIFGHVRINFLNGKISPFADGKVGFAFTRECSTGIYLDGIIGLHIGLTPSTAFNIGLNAKLSGLDLPNQSRSYGNIGLTVGYEF